MLVYNDEHHEYRLDGVVIRSVTQVLKDAGLFDNAFYTKDGAENGKRRHKATELLDRGVLDWGSVIEEDLPYIEAWAKFKEDFKVEIHLIEQQMYHPVLMYAGTIDRMGLVLGRNTIIDLKMGAENRDNELQTILYGNMVEIDGERPDLMVVYCKETGKYKYRKYDYSNEAYAMAALRVSKWKMMK